ncbi:hypothetical protein [Luteibacter sp. 22Crub2.1]|uniref:hypothetical protein n=1 Tax=Luteibacter sp. 22Crub2.1 TaxID=1283288 RepID=UPI0009CF1BD4|nr:hypothetical protein [Luteibacter sp. 22Crub2.1]SKC06055.1 hypothetical protein SAMN05660880_04006 [Luteibacter sp. 22Crub2.1]
MRLSVREIAIALLLASPISVNGEQNHLNGWSGYSICTEQEVVVFACTFKNKKIVSICKSSRGGEDAIIYRYGRPDKVEFTHKDSNSKDGSFYYKMFYNRRSAYFELGFLNEGFTYSVSRDRDEDAAVPTYRLEVRDAVMSGRKGLQLTCERNIVDNRLSNETRVSCDANADVGCNYEDNKAAGRAL